MDAIIVAVIGLLIMGIIAIIMWIIFARLRSRAFQDGFLQGKLQGMREAVDIFWGHAVGSYREADEPEPETVLKAMAAMDRAFTLDHGKGGIKGQITFYQIGISKFGGAVGVAAFHKGYEAGWRDRNSD
jgi:hypothetical protein